MPRSGADRKRAWKQNKRNKRAQGWTNSQIRGSSLSRRGASASGSSKTQIEHLYFDEVYTADILQSQSTIHNTFSNGKQLSNCVRLILAAKASFSDFPPIRVAFAPALSVGGVNRSSSYRYVCIDNRRLFIARVLNLELIPVEVVLWMDEFDNKLAQHPREDADHIATSKASVRDFRKRVRLLFDLETKVEIKLGQVETCISNWRQYQTSFEHDETPFSIDDENVELQRLVDLAESLTVRLTEMTV